MVNKLSPILGSDAKAQKVIENVMKTLAGSYDDDAIIVVLKEQVDALIQDKADQKKIAELES